MNRTLSRPPSGFPGGRQESSGLAASSKKVKGRVANVSGPWSHSSGRHCGTCSLRPPPCPHPVPLRPGSWARHKGGICGGRRGSADCTALRPLLPGEVSAAGRRSPRPPPPSQPRGWGTHLGRVPGVLWVLCSLHGN